jgi:hypothetical protein
MTLSQRNYVVHYIRTLIGGLDEEMQPNTEREFVIDMDATVSMGTDRPRPNFYYAAETQQTHYRCEKCADFNDIRGRFGYCASCGWRNNLTSLKAFLAGLRENLNGQRITPEHGLRTAISEFDACCRDFTQQLAKRIPMKPSRRATFERFVFHDVDSPTVAALKSMLDIDLLKDVGNDVGFLKMMMQRRHIFEHNGGVADARYVRESGDSDGREGILIREVAANVHRLINGLARMSENFDTQFHEIFPPTDWPISHHRRTRTKKLQ